jgi:hypothetical protein
MGFVAIDAIADAVGDPRPADVDDRVPIFREFSLSPQLWRPGGLDLIKGARGAGRANREPDRPATARLRPSAGPSG